MKRREAELKQRRQREAAEAKRAAALAAQQSAARARTQKKSVLEMAAAAGGDADQQGLMDSLMDALSSGHAFTQRTRTPKAQTPRSGMFMLILLLLGNILCTPCCGTHEQ